MQTSKHAKYGYIAFAVFFQFYLAYAATLYMEWSSVSFGFVMITAVTCALILIVAINNDHGNNGMNSIQK